MLLVVSTVALGALLYLFVRRVIVMKPVGVAGIDEAVDRLLQRAQSQLEELTRRSGASEGGGWYSSTLSEHTMEIINGLPAKTCPIEGSQAESTRTPPYTPRQQQQRTAASAAASSAAPSKAATTARELQMPLEFDETFDPAEVTALELEGEGGGEKKKHHRHSRHHKRHHHHRSREGGSRSVDKSEESTEEGGAGGKKRQHKRHRSRAHRSSSGPRLLDAPLLVPGETLPGPDAVDVELQSLQLQPKPQPADSA